MTREFQRLFQYCYRAGINVFERCLFKADVQLLFDLLTRSAACQHLPNVWGVLAIRMESMALNTYHF